MSNTLTIKAKLDGKEVSLELNANEIASAISICEKNSVEEVIAMKRPHKGGALFFTHPGKAAACQDRHNFEHAFTVKLSELKKFKPSDVPAPEVDKRDQAIKDLKALVLELKDSADPKVLEGLKQSIGDKDAEIELLNEEVKALKASKEEAPKEEVKK